MNQHNADIDYTAKLRLLHMPCILHTLYMIAKNYMFLGGEKKRNILKMRNKYIYMYSNPIFSVKNLFSVHCWLL